MKTMDDYVQFDIFVTFVSIIKYQEIEVSIKRLTEAEQERERERAREKLHKEAIAYTVLVGG